MARVMARPRALRLMLLAVLVAGLLIPGVPARACSCAETDLGSVLLDADGAFVGTFVERSEISGQLASITFDVERVVKGEFGPRAIVRTNAYGASCGLEFLDGPRVGLLLDHSADGVWESSLCQQVAPGDLLAIGGDRPPDPDVVPVSAGSSLVSQGFVGAIVAATLALVVLVWVIRRRSRGRAAV